MRSKLKVALIDYGMGNLRSVSKAIEKNGDSVEWVHSPESLKRADLMVLPGVGAFGEAVQNLKKINLIDPIKKWIEQKKPFLGICLGYQLLFEESEEDTGMKSNGLGIFKGKVKLFPKIKGLRVPHMGWNQVISKKKNNALFKGLSKNPYFYFVHSYFPIPRDKIIVHTECDYGIRFASSIKTENLFACQFHPEKSGTNGLTLINNILNLIVRHPRESGDPEKQYDGTRFPLSRE